MSEWNDWIEMRKAAERGAISMTNPSIASDLMPCPFVHEVKRGVFLEVDTEDFGFVRGACSDCGCAGPYVTLDDLDGATEDEKHQAATLWNDRAALSQLTREVDELREALRVIRENEVSRRSSGRVSDATE